MTDSIPIITAIQKKLGIKQDGEAGPQTWGAIAKAMGVAEPAPTEPAKVPISTSGLQRNNWPKEADAGDFFGYPPTLVKFTPPFALKTWDGGWKPVHSFSVNEKVFASVTRIFAAILAHYGSQAAIDAAGMNVFDGCYNDRSVRGSTKRSMHAYGAAMDFNSEKWPLGDATVKMPQAVLDIFHAEGWRTGDTYKGRKDPQHAEACV